MGRVHGRMLGHHFVVLWQDPDDLPVEPDPGKGTDMNNLVEHAKRELEMNGQFAEDPAFSQSIVAAVAAFASYGHSGSSADAARFILHALLNFDNLSSLTNDPDEWEDHGDLSGTPLWQNHRNPKAFSSDGGKTYYVLDEEPRVYRESRHV